MYFINLQSFFISCLKIFIQELSNLIKGHPLLLPTKIRYCYQFFLKCFFKTFPVIGSYLYSVANKFVDVQLNML